MSLPPSAHIFKVLTICDVSGACVINPLGSSINMLLIKVLRRQLCFEKNPFDILGLISLIAVKSDNGGEIVVVGTPETVAEHPTSHKADTSSRCWSSIRQMWLGVEG